MNCNGFFFNGFSNCRFEFWYPPHMWARLPFHKTLFHKTPFPKEPTKRNLSQRNPPKNTHIKKAPIIRIHLTHFWYISDGWNRDKITPFSSWTIFLSPNPKFFSCVVPARREEFFLSTYLQDRVVHLPFFVRFTNFKQFWKAEIISNPIS